MQFVLEPLYKPYAHTLGSDPLQLVAVGRSRRSWCCDLSRFFGESAGLVSMLVLHVPSPQQAAVKVERHYLGDASMYAFTLMLLCHSQGANGAIPTMVHVTI